MDKCTPQPANPHKKGIIILLSLIILLGTGLRIYKLGSNNLWFDEAASIFMSKHMLVNTFTPQPPLYCFLLSYWAKIWGESEFALRFLSLVFSVLAIPLIYALGKLLFNRKTGLISAAILSLSPIHIWYAQELREYSLLPFLIMAFIYFFIRALKENKRRFWAGLVITASLSLYTSYFAFFIIPPATIFFFFKTYRTLAKKWLISCLVIAILYSPWLSKFINHFTWVKNNFWITKPQLSCIRFTFENFALGYNATALSYFLCFIAFSVLFILGLLRGKEQRWHLIGLLLFLFIPLAGSFLVSQWMPIYLDRQNIAVSFLYYLTIAYGFTTLKNNSLSKAAFGIVIAVLPMLSLYNYYINYMPLGYWTSHSAVISPKKDYKKAVAYLKKNMRQDDILAFTHVSAEPPMLYYFNFRYPAGVYYFVFYAQEDEYTRKILTSRAVKKKNADWKDTPTMDLAQGLDQNRFRRVWLITSSWLRTSQVESNCLAVKEWMQEHYKKLQSEEFDGLFIELYEF